MGWRITRLVIPFRALGCSKHYHADRFLLCKRMGNPMTAEQITTIITNLLTGGGVAAVLYHVIPGLKAQIGSMNKTIEVQQKTLEAMEKRVAETEKIGGMYRQLFEELPVEVEKWKTAIVKLKDERIQELEKANQDKDEKLKKTV